MPKTPRRAKAEREGANARADDTGDGVYRPVDRVDADDMRRCWIGILLPHAKDDP
jgi:hypothetical protein